VVHVHACVYAYAYAMPTAAPPTRSPAQTYPFYLGGLSAVGACLFTHPLDQTKYRLQVTQSKASVLGTISETIKSSGGARQLWAGLSASILRRATYSTARFWAYDVFKARAMRNRTGRPPIWLLGSCAGAAGGLAG
jgi:dicarboxylate transporter 10